MLIQILICGKKSLNVSTDMHLKHPASILLLCSDLVEFMALSVRFWGVPSKMRTVKYLVQVHLFQLQAVL